MSMLFAFIVLAAQAQSPAEECVTNGLLSKLETHTILTSFKGKYEIAYADHEHNKSGVEVQEYRFSDENTFQSRVPQALDADGAKRVISQVFFQGKNSMHLDAVLADGTLATQVAMGPEYAAAVSGGWASSWGLDPRRIMGSVGMAAGKDNMDIFGIPLAAFLRAPGPTQCFSRPPYLVVAHRAHVGKSDKSFDVWFDTSSDMDVARIEEVTRSWECPPDMVRKLYSGDLLDLRMAKSSLELSGYADVGNGVRFPTSASMKMYGINGNPSNRGIMEELCRNGHPPAEAMVLYLQKAAYPLEFEATMKLVPEECSFNVPLSDDEFRLRLADGAFVFNDPQNPKQYEVAKERAWYQKPAFLVPLLVFLVAIPMLWYIGRRYMDWKR